ncbi:TPA: hypothetical protein ACGOR9_001725, partial [Streptococcus suis]
QKDDKKALLFCPDGVVSALKQPFFSKNSKKDKHQNDVCLQSEQSGGLFYPRASIARVIIRTSLEISRLVFRSTVY